MSFLLGRILMRPKFVPEENELPENGAATADPK